MTFSLMHWISSPSLMIAPRAVLIRKAVGFMSRISRDPIEWRV
jgi:hypothetical protein